MTREVYDKVCATLTDYEEETKYEISPDDKEYWCHVFYELLVEVQNDSEFA